MRNHIIYGLGGLLLAAGCIRQEFKKSGWNVGLEILGFVLMITAYLIH